MAVPAADETNCIAFPHFLLPVLPRARCGRALRQLGQLLPPLLSVHDKGSQSFAFIAAGKSNGEVNVAVGTGTMVVLAAAKDHLGDGFLEHGPGK